MAVYRCPQCNEIIDRIDFSESQRNFGTYHLPNPDQHSFDSSMLTGNWETEDNQTEGTPTYECPHCDNEIDLEHIILDTQTPTPPIYSTNSPAPRIRFNGFVQTPETDNIPVTNVGTDFNDHVGQSRLMPDYEDYVKCPKCNRVILAGATDRIDSACPHCGTALKTPCGNVQNVLRR